MSWVRSVTCVSGLDKKEVVELNGEELSNLFRTLAEWESALSGCSEDMQAAFEQPLTSEPVP